MPNRIQLKGYGRQEEAVAAGTITPGDLLEVDNAGKVVVHNSEGAVCERAFALEDALQGRTISTNYTSGEVVTMLLAAPGDEVYAFIKAGSNVAIGTILISAGDGTLIPEANAASATVVAQRVAVAMAALDLSASGAVDTRVAVRVL